MESQQKQLRSVDGVQSGKIINPNKQNSTPPKKNKNTNIKIAIICVIIILIGLTSFFIIKYNQVQNQINQLRSNPSAAALSSTQSLVNQVGKLVLLPSGETPTVAEVSDANKLKSQPFFAEAQNGDKVLIYSVAKRAVLYRPSINRVIEFTNLTTQSSTTNQ